MPTSVGNPNPINRGKQINLINIIIFIFIPIHTQATADEELSVMDGEEIDFLESHGDGWCKARNKSGQVGFIPESYVEVRLRGPGSISNDGASSNYSPTSSLTGDSDKWHVSIERPADLPITPIVTEPPVLQEAAMPDFGNYLFKYLILYRLLKA